MPMCREILGFDRSLAWLCGESIIKEHEATMTRTNKYEKKEGARRDKSKRRELRLL